MFLVWAVPTVLFLLGSIWAFRRRRVLEHRSLFALLVYGWMGALGATSALAFLLFFVVLAGSGFADARHGASQGTVLCVLALCLTWLLLPAWRVEREYQDGGPLPGRSAGPRRSRVFTCGNLTAIVAFLGILGFIGLATVSQSWIPFASTAQAVGDSRTVMSAQQTYAADNCGYYAASLLCLTRDGDGEICIPDYPPEAPQFLGGDLARAMPYTKNSYEREFTPFGTPADIPPNCAPGSVLSYCYTSRPVGPSANPPWWAALFLPTMPSYVATPDGIDIDPKGGDPTCQDGRPPPNFRPL